MLRYATILSASFLFGFNAIVYSQLEWRIDQLDVAEGLSQGYVYAIHQDKRGFVWIGTHGGVNRYDGYRFKVFQYAPYDTSTLADNAVFFLREDSATGKFWIGGSSALNEFDPETFTNKRYHYAKKQLEFADGVFINSHEVLLACEHAVLTFNTQTGKFREVPVYEDDRQVPISRVENAVSDRNGNFMVMSRSGIFFYDPESGTCRRRTRTSPDFSAFEGYEVFNVFHDSRGYYWIATNRMGLLRFDATSGMTVSLPLPPTLLNESTRFDVVIEDSQGYIWAGSSNGLFRIDPVSLRSERFSSDNHANGGRLTHNEINAIMEDGNHFMWIGTVGGGVNKMIPKNAGFRNISLARNTGGNRMGTYIMALQQLGSEIWFANIWDQLGYVGLSDSGNDPPTSFIPGFTWYSEGTMVRSDTDELSLLNGEYHYRIVRDVTGKFSVQSHASPGLYYMHRRKNGKLWWMVKGPFPSTFQRNDTIYGNQFFYDAVEDNIGNLWIASSKGLIKYDVGRNQFTHHRHSIENRNTIPSDFIYGLEIDNTRNTLWMATYNGGLCSYRIDSNTFRRYSKENGLSDNTVYSIEKDLRGKLWFGSNAGISEFDPVTGAIRNYTVSDGLLNHEFNRRASFTNDDGWLFFGGVSGIDYFHPDSIVKYDIRSNLAFTGFRVLNNDYDPTVRNGVYVVELQPDVRHITVEFSSLDYSDQRKVQYAYRVNNGEWITTGNESTLSFSDLATGSHHVSIRATSSEGIWLDKEINCLIYVNPWWWEASWFRAGIGLSGLLLLVLAIRFYYHRKLERQKITLGRQQAVEKERTRIATDMHDDLGASLSRIRFLSETVGIKTQKKEGIEEEIGSIRHYALEMIDKMGEIVWALNEKNDSLKDLLAYTRAYSVGYLSQNGIQSKVQTSEDVQNCFVSGEFRRNVYLTVKEALHNIVKHSGASEVEIVMAAGHELFISIHDNGKGFNQEEVRFHSNGIASMKGRISHLGGHFEIRNTMGSMVILKVPLP